MPVHAGPAPAPKAKVDIPNGVNASPLDGGDAGQWESIEKKQESVFRLANRGAFSTP